MRVFVAGGSGAIGRRLVPRLTAAGHEVAAMTRREDRAALLSGLGARPVVCDAFDVERLGRELQAFEPEAVINQLTDLPPQVKPRRLGRYYAANDRLRREGTASLMQAALAAGARRVIAQSNAFWYAPQRDGSLRSEGDPLYLAAPEPVGGAVRTLHEVEQAVLGANETNAVVLRYGFFYGPGTWYAPDADVGVQVRKRRYPVIGAGAGVYSFVHVDDAAAATVAALSGPAGVYNVVDDDPAPTSEWLPAFAEALEAKPPRRVPSAVARLVAGRGPVDWLETLEGAANGHAKAALGWSPRFTSWRVGFREGLD